MLKKIARGVLYVLYLLLVVFAIFYFGFWTSYRDSLLQKDKVLATIRLEPIRHVDARTMRLLGSVRQVKNSSFVNFEQRKSAGDIRVCALGDSNTEGAELGARHDYPSYLQRMFKHHGLDRVEVLNFGNSWYGFSQVYVMWKNVARKFDCDFVLLLPMRFWSERDITFNHSRNLYPGFLHARLVLDDDELRLVAPIGETAERRAKAYIRAIPHWQYLRYDRHPPNILDAPLRGTRTLPNPFYYDARTRVEEVDEIYARLVRSMAADGPRIVIVFRGEQRTLYPGLLGAQPHSIGAALLSETRRFPYAAPAGHLSSWGQELTAMAFFELLTGGPRTDFPLASVKDISAGADAASEALYSYSRVWLEYLGARSGYFALQNNMIQENHNEHLALFRRHEIAAVLSMTAPGGNVANSCLLPLRDIPAGNSELVYVEDSGMGDPRSIGTIYQLQPNVAVFKISLPSPFAVSCTQNLRGMAVGDGHLMLNGNTVARITDNQIEPEHGSMLKLSDSGEHLASIDSLTTPGIMEIVLERDDGARLRRPFLEVHRQPSGVYLDIKQPLKNVIGIAPDE